VDFELLALKIEDKDPEELPEDLAEISNLATMKKLEKYKKRLLRKSNYEEAVSEMKRVWLEYEDTDPDFSLMRKKYVDHFYDAYNEGFEAFVRGDWKKAKSSFEVAESIIGEKDGPINHIMGLMREHNFVKPADWKRESSDH
jgi:hypothetical protein